MNDADRKELMDLIHEYRRATIVEGGSGRIRQLRRIVRHVECVEAAAIERCLKISYDCADEAPSLAARVEARLISSKLHALLPKEES